MPAHPINGLIEMLNSSAKVELTPERLQRLRSLRLPPGPVNINAIDEQDPYGVEGPLDEDKMEAAANDELIESNRSG